MEYRKMTVDYYIGEEEMKRLEALLKVHHEYEKEDGTHPFEKWTVEDIFRSVMRTGCVYVIREQLEAMETRMGIERKEVKNEQSV